MVIASWAVVLSALVYLCFLFGVAHWGDGPGRRLVARGARGPIYALALGVYCTSWTFFGSVGLASRGGIDFLTIYLGPILAIGLGYPLVLRTVRLAKAHNSTSVADFIATRYGKSERVAALVSLVALVGSLPYLSLQLKAVSSSLEIFLAGRGGTVGTIPPFGDVTLAVALVLAGFALAFGTRHSDATEHQNGLVLAIAVESVVKLAAFLAVGLFVVAVAGGGAMGERLAAWRELAGHAWPVANPWYFAMMTALAAFASLLLPRQFHMAVIENRAPEDVRTAAWLFPLYLVAMVVFVVPLAASGLAELALGSVDRDLTVLALPLALGDGTIALVTFLGGFSAATAMVIVETIAVAIMVSNHLVMPLALRALGRDETGRDQRNLGGLVVAIRRVAIVAITLLAYAYYRVADEAEFAAIGFLSFAAIAQIAPAFLGGLFWRRGTELGACAGILAGMAAWTALLFLPSLGADDALRAGMAGLPGFEGLITDSGITLGQVTLGAFWSLALNVLAYVVVSLARAPSALEDRQAQAFVPDPNVTSVAALRFFRARVTVDELRGAVARYLGEDRTRRAFAGFARARGVTLESGAEADSHLLRYAEHVLASAIGASSSRLALSLVLRRRNLSRRAALKLLDDASTAMQQNRDLLQHALDHAQQGITVLDRERHVLSWNQAFLDLYGFPPDLIRIGVALEDVLRVNAERGLYGPGRPDVHVARRLHSMLNDTGPVRIRLHTSGRVISIRTTHLPEGGFFTTYTDVTEIADEEEALELANATLEQRVQERTEELTRLNAELSNAKQQAEEANASKTRFLAAASHDILQPLNAARLYATSLAEKTRGGGEHALAENVEASLDAVEEILTTILDISRFDTGAMEPQLSAFRLDELFRQLEREFAPVAAGKGLSLVFMPSALAVRTDRRLLRRLLQNLVSNALKYTPAGRVLVGARRRGTSVEIAVHDTGLGIPQAQQSTIFVEFRRLSEGARAAPGLGLGLSIVDRIARALGLPLSLASDPGRGTVFRVVVPRAAAMAATPARTRSGPRAEGPLVRLSILALDNEPAILEGMRTLLSGWGCAVACATSLPEALAIMSDGALAPQVIIADYHLGDGNGLEAIAALREAANAPLPAILVTADHSLALREAAATSGIGLLNKPLKPAALRALLTQWRATQVAAE